MNCNKTIIITLGILALAGMMYARFVKNERPLPASLEMPTDRESSSGQNSNSSLPPAHTESPSSQTTTGTFICLSHKDTVGSHTEECAFGIKATDGNNYALYLSDSSLDPSQLPMDGTTFIVTGTITKVEELSTDMWQKYDIAGIIKVTGYSKSTNSSSTSSNNSTVTLKLNQPITVSDTTFKVVGVMEDSRCPTDVYCIQAGTITISILITQSKGPSTTSALQIGKIITAKDVTIALDDVSPRRVSTHKISDSEYKFQFTIKTK